MIVTTSFHEEVEFKWMLKCRQIAISDERVYIKRNFKKVYIYFQENRQEDELRWSQNFGFEILLLFFFNDIMPHESLCIIVKHSFLC